VDIFSRQLRRRAAKHEASRNEDIKTLVITRGIPYAKVKNR
jgi:hypothetical protein